MKTKFVAHEHAAAAGVLLGLAIANIAQVVMEIDWKAAIAAVYAAGLRTRRSVDTNRARLAGLARCAQVNGNPAKVFGDAQLQLLLFKEEVVEIGRSQVTLPEVNPEEA